MMSKYNEIEISILDAAERVFYRKGKDGASMQDIADEANITRTSLNYYYRSKDKLFEMVFRNALTHLYSKVAELMKSQKKFSDYHHEMTEIIIDSMIDRPQIPVFVLQELNSNPERVQQIMSEFGLNSTEIMQSIAEDDVIQKLTIDPRHLIMNILSMCIFPFAGKPLMVSVMYGGDEDAYIKAMKERKEIISVMIENMIKSFSS